jgi:hypothetical protein
MKLWLLVVFLFTDLCCFAQDKPVEGIVFDKTTKERIASISVHDINKHLTVYNNLKGEFKIKADIGDQLVFSRQEYRPDTIKVLNKEALVIYMQRIVIQLKEVTVRDSALTPEQQLEKTKEEYSKIYSPSLNPDFFSNSDYGGVGISIDAIWNSFSREGRNAAALRALIERDYEQHVIDYRFSRTFVERVTGLKDGKLTSFMTRYRPGYYTVTTMTDYEFITMIRANLRRYLRNQRTYTLPPLSRS